MFKKKNKFHSLEEVKKPEVKWWNLKLEEIYSRLEVENEGLTDKKAKERQKKYGLNELVEREKQGPLDILIAQMKSVMVIVLVAAALISFVIGEGINAAVILLAVIINVLVGFGQELKTSRALKALKKIVVSSAKVVRNEEEKVIETSQLVPGDVVLLMPGDKIPADLRLIETVNLKINEAVLTGESAPRDKKEGILKEDIVLAERENMAFMGTLVVQGSGRGMIVETGMGTAVGKIAELVAGVSEGKTPLQEKLDRFAWFLTKLVLAAAVGVFILGVVFGHAWSEMFSTAVAIAVSAIPEGLAVTVTVVLAVGMQRILKKHSLVRRLLGAEILGSTNVICADKTGTITEGNMQVVRIVTEDSHINLKSGLTEVEEQSAEEQLFLLRIGMLCNNAYIAEKKEKLTIDKIVGNLTEKALLLAGIHGGLDKEALEKKFKRLDEIPFDARYKFMMTLNKEDKEHNIINLKGAPEKVLFFSNYVYSQKTNQKIELTSYKRDKILKMYEQMSKEGLRVLALAYKEVSMSVNCISNNPTHISENESPKQRQAMADLYTNFVFVGLVGIKDPIRENVKETIERTRRAGIETVMITGDNKYTAKVIAEEAGLVVKEENILEGDELEKISESELKKKVKDIKVYARTTPEQKLKIVKAWQEVGAVVAMTGDGINDAPALKQANMGVALGTATDVAKESADLILLNNNFKTIVEAVKQGRIIFTNIKKIILYYLSDSMTEVIIIVVALILKWPLPILAAQIIWVNLIDDTFPALSLTQDPPGHDVMKDKPVPAIKLGKESNLQDQSVLDNENKLIIFLVSLVGALLVLLTFYIFWQGQAENFELANSMAFSLLATSTLIYVFSLRDLQKPVWKTKVYNNPVLMLSVLVGFALQVLVIQNPYLQGVFSTTAMSLWHWIYVIGGGILVAGFIECIKWLFYKSKS